ncbi:DUF6339 family protein, partial [Haloferula chungangensis]
MKTRLKLITSEALNHFTANFEYFIRGIATGDKNVLSELYDENNFSDSNIEFEYTPLIQNGTYNVTDYKNIKILYETFENLTPVQASQERLWVSLTLNHYMDYFKYRTESYFNNLKEGIKIEESIKGLKAAILYSW